MINSEFLLASLVVILIPGTGAVYTISTALSQNWRASIAAAIGCTLGIVPHIVASVLGLSAIMNMSAQVFSAIKIVGAVYLFYLAWKMWREAGSMEMGGKTFESKPFKIILKAIALNLLNPKLTIFFFAFLPLFISKSTVTPTFEMIKLSILFMVITLVVFAIYGLLASAISSSIKNSPKIMKWIQRTFAVILAGFAVKLAFTEK